MAQRIEPEGLIVGCDFCGTDWDGESPVIEGHRGAIICLECVKAALGEMKVREGEFGCVLCLRDKIPGSVARFEHANKPGVFACEGCVRQAAEVFSKDSDVPWTWDEMEK